MATEQEEVVEIPKAPPAMWGHVSRVYDAMANEVKETYPFEEKELPLYVGFTSRLVTDELHIPVPYYGNLMNILQLMGCIVQVKRGGGPAPSQWVLLKKPTIEDFTEVYEPSPSRSRRQSATQKVVTQQIGDIRTALGGVDVPKAIAELQVQINTLEAHVTEHETFYQRHLEAGHPDLTDDPRDADGN